MKDIIRLLVSFSIFRNNWGHLLEEKDMFFMS